MIHHSSTNLNNFTKNIKFQISKTNQPLNYPLSCHLKYWVISNKRKTSRQNMIKAVPLSESNQSQAWALYFLIGSTRTEKDPRRIAMQICYIKESECEMRSANCSSFISDSLTLPAAKARLKIFNGIVNLCGGSRSRSLINIGRVNKERLIIMLIIC